MKWSRLATESERLRAGHVLKESGCGILDDGGKHGSVVQTLLEHPVGFAESLACDARTPEHNIGSRAGLTKHGSVIGGRNDTIPSQL